MPENESKRFLEMQPLIKREILRMNRSASNLGQYRGANIDIHRHDDIGSPAILYTNLSGVKNFLVSNTVILSPAQVQALHSVPVVLVAPPAARSFIFVDGIAGRLTFPATGGAKYTGTNNLEFHYTNGSGLKVCADMPATIFLNSTVSTYSYSPAPIELNRTVDFNFTPTGGGTALNGQIVVSVPNANPAAGNSIVTLTVFYRVVTFVT